MDITLVEPADLQRRIEAGLELATSRILSKIEGKSKPEKEWLSNREALDFLGLSKTTLQRYRASGILPYSKIGGGSIYYRRSDLVGLLERGLRLPATAEVGE